MPHEKPSSRPDWPAILRELPLSPLQHAMLVSTLAQPETGLDVLQVVIRTREGLRPERVREAFRHLVGTHDALRSCFRWQALAHPVTVTVGSVPLPFETATVSPEQFSAWLKEESARPFSMDRAPLCRVTLVDLGGGEQAIVWTVHHAIVDGGSMRAALRHWQAVLDGVPPGPVPASQSGPEVLARRLRSLDVGRAQAWWSKALGGLTAPTRPMLWLGCPSNERLEVKASIDGAGVAALRKLAEGAQASLNNVVQTAWGLALSAYSGESKVSFGVTHAGRRGEAQADDLVGMFIGTVPLVVTVAPADNVRQLVERVRDYWRATRGLEHTAPVDLRRWSGWSHGAPLFESVMVFDPHSLAQALRAEHPAWASRDVALIDSSTVPISLMVAGEHELELRLSYDPGCLAPDVARALLDTTVHLLSQLACHGAGTVADLTFTASPPVPVPSANSPAPSVLERLMRHAAQTPHAAAVEHRGQQMSYAALLASSCTLARSLSRAITLEPGDAVAVVVERGLPLAGTLWALQILGVAYAPVEPSLLATQLPAVAGNSRVRCVLTTRKLAARLPAQSLPVLLLEDLLPEGELKASKAPPSFEGLPAPQQVASAELPAYVLYTSGSTGMPKGVEISQRSLARYVQTCGELYKTRAGMRWLQLASLSFDISIEELFVTWGWGGTVVFKPEDQMQSVEQLEQWLTELRIDAVSPPTALWHEWASRAGDASKVPPTLGLVVIGGEAASMAAYARWQDSPYHKVRLLNAYGPTEATISVTCFEPGVQGPDSIVWSLQHMPIGHPLEGIQARVVGATGKEAPVGAPGELWVAGEQLALGYSDAPELTAAAFVTHPDVGRCYKTGDVVCRLPDGQLAFLHRRDRQVKLRGFRVELGGLEAALQDHPAVTQSLFMQRPEGGRLRLWAWVVLDRPVEVRELYTHLRALVPSYALPEAIIVVDHLPTNAAGKIDPEALPKPSVASAAPPPTTNDDVYRGLFEVWSRRFPGQPLTPDARLFEDLGVDSLTALLMLAEVQARFGCSLPVGVLARADTLSSLAEEIRGHLGYEVAHRHAVTLRGYGSLPPLFLVHGGDGHALVFRELVPLLSLERPCYAFDAGAFDTNRRMDVKAIATAYVAELQRLQPTGRVHLSAFCLGGLVILEMAALLSEAGREVAFLGLINTYVPGFPQLRSLPARLAVGLRDGTLSEQLRVGLATRLGLSKPEEESPLALLLNHAADTYTPEPIPLHVHLFRGTGNPRLYEPEDLGWGRYCRGGLRLHPRLPISHTEMLTGRHVVTLAEQIESALTQLKTT